MPQRLTDHLNRNTTILSGSSPGMTDSIEVTGEVSRRAFASLSDDYWTCGERTDIPGMHFHLLSSCRQEGYWTDSRDNPDEKADSCEADWLYPVQYPVLPHSSEFSSWYDYTGWYSVPAKISPDEQGSERHSAELKHQGSDSLCTTQTFRFGIFIEEAIKFSDRQRFLLANIHSRINIMKQTMHIRSSARLHSSIIDATKHTHIRWYRIRLQTGTIKILPVTAQAFTGDLPESNMGSATKLGKRKKTFV